MKLVGIALLSLVLSACSSGSIQNVKMEDTLNSYASAIRWGAFDRAIEFQSPLRRTRLDEPWLKNVHVSSYDLLHRKHDKGSNILEQKVEIRYYNDLVGVEKILTDRQVWRYYADTDRWMLESDLPIFP